jgi:hypothetical protein
VTLRAEAAVGDGVTLRLGEATGRIVAAPGPTL